VVAMHVGGLTLARELTIIFHGRRDSRRSKPTSPSRARHGRGPVAQRAAARAVYLDLAQADSRRAAQDLYREQAGVLRETLRAADTVLSVWWEPLTEYAAAQVRVERLIGATVELPAQLLMPVALRAPERELMVAAVCSRAR